MPRVEPARDAGCKRPRRARLRKLTPQPARQALAARASMCAPVGLALLLCCAGLCHGAEQPGVAQVSAVAVAAPSRSAAAVPPPTRVVPAAPAGLLPPASDGPALDMLEYLGALQHDEQGWYGAEDINDGTALPPPAAARATAAGEDSKP